MALNSGAVVVIIGVTVSSTPVTVTAAAIALLAVIVVARNQTYRSTMADSQRRGAVFSDLAIQSKIRTADTQRRIQRLNDSKVVDAETEWVDGS